MKRVSVISSGITSGSQTFWMTGPGTVKRLEKHGIHTMGELAYFSTVNQDILYREFGVDAELLIDHA